MQNIGERLEEARKRKGISIREAAEATKIRSDYLHKFESNQFDLNLAEIYVRGFLRNYATFLKLPADKILNDYAALGRGDTKPRQPSREIYGRMDVSVASAEERAAEKPAAPQETGGAPEPAQRAAGGLGRSGSSLPVGPAIPPQWIFRGLVGLGAIIVLLLVVWVVKAIVSDPSPPVGNASTAGTSPALSRVEPTITLIALDTVRVKVVQVSDNRELYQGTLVRGQTQVVPKNGELFITASAGKNLQVEINGKRYPMPFEEYDRARIP
jgi:transcriptional regulator with XRE-family HTH domain